MTVRYLRGVDGSIVIVGDGYRNPRPPPDLPPFRRRYIYTTTTREIIVENADIITQAQPQDAQSAVVSTFEEVLEKITNTSTPQASTGVLLDWSISMLKNALGLGGMAATTDAVKAHVETLEATKDKLAEAVAATPE